MIANASLTEKGTVNERAARWKVPAIGYFFDAGVGMMRGCCNGCVRMYTEYQSLS